MGRSGPDRGPSSVSGNAYRYRLRRACSCVLSKGSSARSARRGSSGPTMVRQPTRIVTSKLSTQRILHSPSRPDANRPAPALPQHYGSSPPGCAVSAWCQPTSTLSAPALWFGSSRFCRVGVMPTDQHPFCLSPMVRLFQVLPCRRHANRPAPALPQCYRSPIPGCAVSASCQPTGTRSASALWFGSYRFCRVGAMPTDRHPLCGNYALLVGMEQTVCPPHVPQCTPAGFVKPPRPPKSASSIPSPDLEKLTTTCGDSET